MIPSNKKNQDKKGEGKRSRPPRADKTAGASNGGSRHSPEALPPDAKRVVLTPSLQQILEEPEAEIIPADQKSNSGLRIHTHGEFGLKKLRASPVPMESEMIPLKRESMLFPPKIVPPDSATMHSRKPSRKYSKRGGSLAKPLGGLNSPMSNQSGTRKFQSIRSESEKSLLMLRNITLGQQVSEQARIREEMEHKLKVFKFKIMNEIEDKKVSLFLDSKIKPEEREKMATFGEMTNIKLKKFYYHKVWISYGLITMVLSLQCILFCTIKRKEYYCQKQVLEALDDPKAPYPVDDAGKFDISYTLLALLDITLIYLFFQLNYHKIEWKKICNTFDSLGITLPSYKQECVELGAVRNDSSSQLKVTSDFWERPWFFTVNYLDAYSAFIIKSLLVLLQPYEFLNWEYTSESIQRPETYEVFQKMVAASKNSGRDYIRYYGMTNNFLIFAYIMIRFLMTLKHMVTFRFYDKVKMSRIYRITGSHFRFINMIKDIYREYAEKATATLLLFCLVLFIVLIMEFELKILTFDSVRYTIFYTIVTMTTVGYGDLVVLSNIGYVSMVMATFLGVIFEGFFLLAWSNFTAMTKSERSAYTLLKRLKLKEQMKVLAVRMFIVVRRFQIIERKKRALRRKKKLSAEKIEAFGEKEILELNSEQIKLTDQYGNLKKQYDFMLLGWDAFKKQRLFEKMALASNEIRELKMQHDLQIQKIMELQVLFNDNLERLKRVIELESGSRCD